MLPETAATYHWGREGGQRACVRHQLDHCDTPPMTPLSTFTTPFNKRKINGNSNDYSNNQKRKQHTSGGGRGPVSLCDINKTTATATLTTPSPTLATKLNKRKIR